MWLQEIQTTLTWSPLRSPFLISKYLIASCYVNAARFKYHLQHTLCTSVLMFYGDSQLLSIDDRAIL